MKKSQRKLPPTDPISPLNSQGNAAGHDAGETPPAKEAASTHAPATDSLPPQGGKGNWKGPRKKPIPWPPTAEFLRLLWEKPVLCIAADLDCGASAVSVRAKKLGLQPPGGAYWQKKKFGLAPPIPEEVAALMRILDSSTPIHQPPECDSPGIPRRRKAIAWPSKAELLRLIWAKPLTHIARELGCSTVAVFLRANRLKLPTPGMAYWHRKRMGIEMEIPEEVKALMEALDIEEAGSADCGI